jgi:hypothetical protein
MPESKAQQVLALAHQIGVLRSRDLEPWASIGSTYAA